MSCVTAIEATWLSTLAEGSPLLSFSEPLVSPPPTYDETSHVVMCLVTPRYGVHAWELPPHRTQLATAAPVNKPDVVFRWFGRLLLEGGVSGCLSELKGEEMLNDPPSLLTRETPTKKVCAARLLRLFAFCLLFFPCWLVCRWEGVYLCCLFYCLYPFCWHGCIGWVFVFLDVGVLYGKTGFDTCVKQ